MTFTVATYNVLAPSYLNKEWYPFTPKELFSSSKRIPALVEHLVQLQADILCLQEVEAEPFTMFAERLSKLGYAGEWTMKARGKPDGCAIFVQTRRFQPVRVCRIDYHDGDHEELHSGHIAQFLVLKDREHVFGIANTHLKWDPPNAPLEQRYGYRQIRQLLSERGAQAPECSSWIVCGDLNVAHDNDVVKALREGGFEFSHVSCLEAATCNPNGRAKMIDFIFHDGKLQAEPVALPQINDDTPLPGPDQPSDHVAVMARLNWRAG